MPEPGPGPATRLVPPVAILDRADRPAVPDDLAGLLHDLRSPLTVIAGACFALRRDAPAAALRLVERIEDEAARIAERVDRAGRLAGVGGGGTGTGRVRVDLGEVVAGVVARFGVAAARLAVDLRAADPGPFALPADVDPAAVERLVENLLGNAMRHAGSGGRVAVDASRWGRHAVLRIADDGPGFAGDPGPAHGWGIGLAVARGIARDHGGDIVHEPSAVGAVFRVRLPLAEAERDPTGRSAA
jgi:signal transduction histidine kinase